MNPPPRTLEEFNLAVEACQRCPRLHAYCAEIARVKRRMWATSEYWGRAVPSFGDPQARVAMLGLAPGAHGSNRTGRMFTGDGSGEFLFPVLYEAGFASQPKAIDRDDGMKLHDLWITAVGHCAPPGNKPTRQELENCAPWLDLELTLLRRLRVVVCLGKIAFDGILAHSLRTGQITSRKGLIFGHGNQYALPDGLILLASYHPSLQNTNTGRLTRPMFLEIFQRARQLSGGLAS